MRAVLMICTLCIADAIKSTWLIDKGETYFLLIFLAISLIMDFAEWFKKLSK